MSPVPASGMSRRYRVEIFDGSGTAVEHIHCGSGHEAVNAARDAYPNAFGFTVCAAPGAAP